MLKPANIFVLSLFFFVKVDAQTIPDTFYRRALDLKYENMYDSALNMFQEMYNRSGRKYYARAHGNIADIELKLGNLDLADSLYRLCLRDTNKDAELEKYLATLKLADIRIKDKNYREGLLYLDIHQTYKPGIFCSVGSYERRLALNWRYSKCLSGIGDIDSAINLLTPFMFKGRELISFNEKYYDSLGNYYYGLLLKKFGRCEVQELVRNSIDSLHYKESLDTTSSLKLPEMEGMKVECSMSFLNREIRLMNSTLLWMKGTTYKSPYSKEYFLADIKRSILYKLIMK